MFLEKSVLKICSKFREHPCHGAISIKLLWTFIEITLRHGCSPVNASGRLLLYLNQKTGKTLVISFWCHSHNNCYLCDQWRWLLLLMFWTFWGYRNFRTASFKEHLILSKVHLYNLTKSKLHYGYFHLILSVKFRSSLAPT